MTAHAGYEQSKTLILSRNIDQIYLETEFSSRVTNGNRKHCFLLVAINLWIAHKAIWLVAIF